MEGFGNLFEAGLVAGKVSGRFIYPPRPLHPVAKTIDKWFRGTGLSVRRAYDNDLSRYAYSVDGKFEGDFNASWGLGCTGADTFTYRTRAPLIPSPLTYTLDLFDSGELVINGNIFATFTTTGTQPYLDLVGHLLLKVPGVGTLTYDYPDSIFYGPVADAGRCTP